MKNIRLFTHSSVLIEDSLKIYVDPFNIREESHDADIICVTHDHYDHFSPEDIKKVMNEGTIFIAPYSLKGKLPSRNVMYLRPFEKVVIDGVYIEARPAYNKDKPFHPKHNEWVGYLIRMDAESYYVVGDSDALEENADLQVNYLFVPIGGTYTMDITSAAEFTNTLKPKVVIPTHYGSVVGKEDDGKNFSSLIDKDIEVQIIKEY